MKRFDCILKTLLNLMLTVYNGGTNVRYYT